MNELKIRATREIWNDSIALYLGIKNEIGSISIAEQIMFKESPTYMVSEPCLRMRLEEAQRLMDELWDCGLRPSEGTGSAGALSATKNHLEDMRKLVFSTQPNNEAKAESTKFEC